MALLRVTVIDYSQNCWQHYTCSYGIINTKTNRHSKSKLPFHQDNNEKYSTNNCGLVNKGMPHCSVQVQWSNFGPFCSANTNKLLQFVAAFVKIMSLLQTFKGALDPSYFLKYQRQIISKAGNPTLDLFFQQDAAEILSYILEELCEESIHASESIKIHIRQTVSCTVCQ